MIDLPAPDSESRSPAAEFVTTHWSVLLAAGQKIYRKLRMALEPKPLPEILIIERQGVHDRILRRLNRKERKERRDSGQKGRGLALAAGRVLRPGKLAHLELIGAEVDEQTMFETGGLQVTKNLSHMLVGQSLGSF